MIAVEWKEILGGFAPEMARTLQNPRWHGEGDVLTHTRNVCGELQKLESWKNGDTEFQKSLYLAAALHDIGKVPTTRLEAGEWVSPGHARVGAQMARRRLWQNFDLCGTPEKQRLRETVCNLVRYHSVPAYAISDWDGERTLRKVAANGELVPGFSLEMLCLLAEADARGRICRDVKDMLERIGLCRELAMDAGCLAGAYPFPSAHTAYAYLSGKNVPAEYALYDDSWGEVILMSGLPGTGKDTWIGEHCPDLPMISLDDIRKELGILPLDNQGRVVDTARERAKELLRKKQPFVWNATNITPQTRARQVELFAGYGASVGIVYLETAWDEVLRRNAGRADAVPEQAICHMLEKLVPPERFEAHRVQWHCI